MSYERGFNIFVYSPNLLSCLFSIEAGADIVLLYGHFVPKLALSVLTIVGSEVCDNASCALCNFFANPSLV